MRLRPEEAQRSPGPRSCSWGLPRTLPDVQEALRGVTYVGSNSFRDLYSLYGAIPCSFIEQILKQDFDFDFHS